MRMNLALKNLKIEDVDIDDIVLEHIDYVVISEGSNITGSNEKIEITGFKGSISVTDSAVLFEGNVSIVRNGKWSIG